MMQGIERDGLRTAIAGSIVVATAMGACGPAGPPSQESGSGTSTTTAGSTTTSAGAVDESTGVKLDISSHTDFAFPPCLADDTCHAIDILLVIDNSGTMAEEQLNIARNLPRLVEDITQYIDYDGDIVNPNVNLMVTTTDVGHPLCTPFQKPDYEPRQGAPVYQGCNARIERFTGLDPMDPVVVEEACTEGCPVDVVPDGPFIHFSVVGTNVPDDDVAAALACIGPQGIDGCAYASPLEAMLRALDPQACWNDPEQPECDEAAEWADLAQGFLRPDAALAIVFVADGMDCSVAPDGDAYFTEDPLHWSIDPSLGIPRASPAICTNAGVSCTDDDGDGIYEECTLTDGDVLQPIDRYVSYLDQLVQEQDKEVVMMGVLGVPEVLRHSSRPPFGPSDGGAFDLVYRDWIDAPHPAGDILPDAWDAGRRAADEIFERGRLAPGCIGTDEAGALIGHALPPLRMREVCESLSYVDEDDGAEQVRCCIESICDPDFREIMRCIMPLLHTPTYTD